MSIKSFGERIADVLIEDGLLLPSQLEEAVDLQKKQGGRLLKLLVDKQYVTEQDMVISMGRCLDTPPINLSKVRVPENIQELVPKEMARQYKLAPVCRLGNKLYVAMAHPLNVLALDDLRQRTKLEIVAMITTERAVTEALSGVGSASAQMDQVLKDAANMEGSGIEEVRQQREEIDLDRLAVESEDAPVVEIVNLILVQALKEKASDIHIEPFEKQLKLRYRVDVPHRNDRRQGAQASVASRIKILAGLLPSAATGTAASASGFRGRSRSSYLRPADRLAKDRYPSPRQRRASGSSTTRDGRATLGVFKKAVCTARNAARHRPDRLGATTLYPC
jgi:type IV pilus assembly protein PilB